jgi:hypothetical protein
MENKVMKRYIKPTTDMYAVAAQQMMAGSPKLDTEEMTPGGMEAKNVGFFTAEESAENNEYPVYNVWED